MSFITLEGKRGLVVGIANDSSIAFGCAKAFRALGAELAVTYLNAKAERHVKPLADELEACRGRDGSYLPPPAQIPACGFPAPGSCRKSGVVDVRGLGGPSSIDPRADASRDMLGPALCPGHASASSSPPGRVPSLHTLRRRSSRPC